MDEREKDAVVKNETLFRDVNERVKEIDHAHHVSTAERWDFLCECGKADCLDRVELRPEEYEEIRASPVHFAVVPGHENPEVERVIRRGDSYLVVEKLPDEQDLARAMDPRR
ncbi:MAG: hypothetical protein KY396_05275 [Actinobacteria bacterium]|nr:hypothetical protein [Actinomycetota bacterium]